MPVSLNALLSDWGPAARFLLGAVLLLIATQLVVIVLNKLERRQFGPVLLGALVTPMCTGFPNLMLGLFGRSEQQTDLVLQLNIGNNLANTTLVTGMILLIAGPLTIGAGKGRSKKGSPGAVASWRDPVFLLGFGRSPILVGAGRRD